MDAVMMDGPMETGKPLRVTKAIRKASMRRATVTPVPSAIEPGSVRRDVGPVYLTGPVERLSARHGSLSMALAPFRSTFGQLGLVFAQQV